MRQHIFSLVFVILFTKQAVCHHDVVEIVGSIQAGTNNDTLSGVSLIPDDTTFIFTETGRVISFTYSASDLNLEVKFQIWRPDSGTRFTLIHQSGSVQPSSTSDTNTYYLSSDEVFTVQQGDTIGIALVGDSPLKYTTVDCTESTLLPLTASGSVGSGSAVTFSRDGSECKQFVFQAEVIYDSAPAVSVNCTGNLTANEGWQTFNSPGYDGSTLYSIDIDTCWEITMEPGSREGTWGIQVQFLSFNFENASISGACIGDTLSFTDGNSIYAPLLNEICGFTPPEFISGTSDFMYVRMYTDSLELTVSTGFLAQYRLYQISTPEQKVPVWALVLAVLGFILLLAVIGVVIFLYFKLRKQRKDEYLEKLKDGEVNDGFIDNRSEDNFDNYRRKRSRAVSPKLSPMMIRREKSLYNDPKGPEIRVHAHRDANLKEHIPDDRIPQASDYKSPRKANKKMKHWSKIGSGITD